MEIKINETQIQETLNNVSTKSIQQAFESYSIKSVLEKTISDSVIPKIMTNAIIDASEKININELSTALAKEISRAVTRGVQNIIQETMISIILDIRKVPNYDDNKRKEGRENIINTVFKNR